MPTTLRPLPGVRIVVKGSRHHKSGRVGTEDIFLYEKELLEIDDTDYE